MNVFFRFTLDLPSESVNPKQGFHLGAINSLSGVGGHQLELLVLAQLTGNSSYSDRVARLRRFLQRNIQKQFYNAHAGYMDWVDVQAGTWFYTTTSGSGSGSGGSPGITGGKTLPTESLTVSFSSDGADYYRSLLSTFLQNPTSSDSATAESWILLEEALRSALRIGLFAASPNSSLIYSRSYSYSSDTYGDHMTADSCYLGGLLATSGRLLEDRLSANRSLGATDRKQELQLVHQLAVLAEGITETCSAVSRATNSGLPPSRWYFNAAQDGTNVGGSLETLFEKSYDLSGELAESYFVLHRLTGEEKYRTAAWELAQAIYRHCKIEGEVGVAAYAGLADVDLVPRTRNLGPGHQPAIFLSATLKYLYLIFSEGTVLPLDQWVFNTAGHPLPIRK